MASHPGKGEHVLDFLRRPCPGARDARASWFSTTPPTTAPRRSARPTGKLAKRSFWLRYLPASSPELNASEYTFRTFKHGAMPRAHLHDHLGADGGRGGDRQVTVTATRSRVVGCRGLIQPTEFRHGRRGLPGPAVDLRRPAPAQPSLQAYLDRFRPLFRHRDQAVSFVAYAEGLLSDERRKSVERMVLRRLGGDMNQVRRLQYFAADSAWSDQPFLERHWQAVGSLLGTREGVLLVDTTDMPKQGVSVGVARQYCGRLGQVANCQAGVFVAYAGEGGLPRVHRRLFLTEAASFRTKPQLALAMLTELVAGGLAAGPLGDLR